MKKIYFIIYSFLNLFKFHFLYRKLGNFLDKVRMKFLVLSGAQIGKDSVVREKTFILDPEKLNIGENSSIGFYSEIYNSEDVNYSYISKLDNKIKYSSSIFMYTSVNNSIAADYFYTTLSYISDVAILNISDVTISKCYKKL